MPALTSTFDPAGDAARANEEAMLARLAELDELLDAAAAVGEAAEIVDEILASLGDRERAAGGRA